MRGILRKLNRHRWGIWDVRELLLDLRYGGYIGGRTESKFSHLGANAVQSMPYRVIEDAVKAAGICPSDVLVDVGCGLGRVINWLLNLGLTNEIVGIELDPEVAERTRRRLRRYKNVSIVTGDAVQLTPPDTTVCFLFNPFGREVLQKWHDRLLDRLTSKSLKVVYINCQCLDVFEQSGAWTIQEVPKHPADYSRISLIRLKTPIRTAGKGQT